MGSRLGNPKTRPQPKELSAELVVQTWAKQDELILVECLFQTIAKQDELILALQEQVRVLTDIGSLDLSARRT